MVLPLGRGREPPRPEGGSSETPGHVQLHSLLCESVTGGDLHKHEPCFISPDKVPALRHPQPPLGRPETRTMPRGKGDASGTLGNHGPSAGGRARRRLPGRRPTFRRHLAPHDLCEGLAPNPFRAAPSGLPLAGVVRESWIRGSSDGRTM